MHRRQFIFSGSAIAGAALHSATASAAEVLPGGALLHPVAPSTNGGVRPFKIAVPRAQLVDLQERLAKTRWPDKETVGDIRQGPPLANVRHLVERWQKPDQTHKFALVGFKPLGRSALGPIADGRNGLFDSVCSSFATLRQNYCKLRENTANSLRSF